MSKLSTSARKHMAKGEFALPGSRSYPINDRAHAANAKARAAQQYNAGRISKSTEMKIFAAANKVLGRHRGN